MTCRQRAGRQRSDAGEVAIPERVEGDAVVLGVHAGEDPSAISDRDPRDVARGEPGIDDDRRVERAGRPRPPPPIEDISVRLDHQDVLRTVAVNVRDQGTRVGGRHDLVGGLEAASADPQHQGDGPGVAHDQVGLAIAVEVAGQNAGAGRQGRHRLERAVAIAPQPLIARGRERGKSLGEEVEAAVAIQVGGEQQTRLTDPGVGEMGGPERAVAIAQEGRDARHPRMPRPGPGGIRP